MDKSKADAIIKAVLDSSIHAQSENRRKRAIETARRARMHRIHAFTLIGLFIGATIAYFISVPFALAIIIWGGVAGSVVGRLTTRQEA
ncbi:MAG: hypothetical protein ACOH1V_07845 [Stenotrophomonas sp.]